MLKSHLIAGAITGLFGVAVFGLVHHIIIEPIWDRLATGIPFGLVGGLAMGWAFFEIRRAGRIHAGLWGGPAFGLVLWLTLAPMTAVGAYFRAAGMHGNVGDLEMAVELLLAVGAGSLAGGLLTRRWRPALAVGVATLTLALVMGGPIPVLNSARAGRLFAAFALLYPLCGLALAAMASALSSQRRPRT